MSETEQVRVGDIILTGPGYRYGLHVVTGVTPQLGSGAIIQGPNGETQVTLPGTIRGAVRVLGAMSVEAMVEGLRAYMGPAMSQDYEATCRTSFAEQQTHGPVEWPLLQDPPLGPSI